MTRYNKDDLGIIFQSSYYDTRTDFVWNYILDDKFDNDPIPIPTIDCFLVMHEMEKNRELTTEAFLEAWKTTGHPELTSCSYSPRSGILRVKARTYTFTYREKLKEYHFVVPAKIAKAISVESRELKKRFRRGGLFPLSLMAELDEQMYDRYDEQVKLRAWRKSPQFAEDIAYCKQMIPVIVDDAEARKRYLVEGRRLNIILEGNDRVRIGVIEVYSPEEMKAMPVYRREDWHQGILAAFEAAKKKYDTELELCGRALREWSDELSRIVLGKAPYSVEQRPNCYLSYHAIDRYMYRLILAALGLPPQEEDATPRTRNFFIIPRGRRRAAEPDEQKRTLTYETFSAVVDRPKRTVTITIKEEIARFLHYEPVTVLKIRRDALITEEWLSDEDYTLQHEYSYALDLQQRERSALHPQLVEMVRYIIDQTAPLIAYTGTCCREIFREYEIHLTIDDNNRIEVGIRTSDSYKRETFELDSYRTAFRVWWSRLLLTECKRAKELALHPERGWPFDYGPF